MLGYNEVGICAGADVLYGVSGGQLAENKTGGGHFEIAAFGNDIADAVSAGQRQSTMLYDLGGAVLVAVIRSHDDALHTGANIHCATHADEELAGDHPVGKTALLVDLQRCYRVHRGIKTVKKPRRVFRRARRKINRIHFPRRRVRRGKYFSLRECRAQRGAGLSAIFFVKEPLVL